MKDILITVKQTEEFLKNQIDKYSPRVSLASSFNPEDIVVIDMLSHVSKNFRVFSIDTGRLPEETYECAERISNFYKIKIEWYFPDTNQVQELESEKGLYSFRNGISDRKLCCAIRKLEPLRRALLGLDAWISGIRRDQNVTRKNYSQIEKDFDHDIIKINPLISWNHQMVWDYIKSKKLPYNRLHDEQFPSIGCAPCTRKVEKGENERSGRWWWENPEHKECGIHSNKRGRI